MIAPLRTPERPQLQDWRGPWVTLTSTSTSGNLATGPPPSTAGDTSCPQMLSRKERRGRKASYFFYCLSVEWGSLTCQQLEDSRHTLLIVIALKVPGTKLDTQQVLKTCHGLTGHMQTHCPLSFGFSLSQSKDATCSSLLPPLHLSLMPWHLGRRAGQLSWSARPETYAT